MGTFEWASCPVRNQGLSSPETLPPHKPCSPGTTECPVQAPQCTARPREFAACPEMGPAWAATARATTLQLFVHILGPPLPPRFLLQGSEPQD